MLAYIRIIFAVVLVLLIVGIVAIIIAATKKKQPATTDRTKASYFDGTTLQLIGYRILTALITGITLGIAFPWAICMLLRWETKHTVINGRRLRFVGKGIHLLGSYLLWGFLTLITLGIYGLWFGLNLKRWIVKNTVYEDEDLDLDSFFSGRIGGYIGIHLLAGLLTFCTLGIGAAWGQKMILEWEARHTHIGGSPLVFTGTGGQLFGKYLLFILLTPLTLGIYAIFYPVRILRWKYSHTDAVYQTLPIQLQVKAHEDQARHDYAQFHLAANDTELSVMRSGITYKETPEELEVLAQNGNRYAMYRLSLLKRQESDTEAELHWLKLAADQNYHPAMLDYSRVCLSQDQELALQYLEGAARNGNCEAPWLLACYYSEQKDADYFQQAYWFRVALEWNDPRALESRDSYDTVLRIIACLLAESSQTPAKSSGAVIAAVVGGVLMLLLLLGAAAAWLLGFGAGKKQVVRVPQQATTAPLLSTTAPTQPTAAPSADLTPLVGEWVGWDGVVTYDDWFGDGNLREITRCIHLVFSRDGTFTCTARSYFVNDDHSLTENVNPSVYHGTFTIRDNILAVQYTYIQHPAMEPQETIDRAAQCPFEINGNTLSVDNCILLFDEAGYETLYRDTAENVVKKGLADREPTVDTTLVGSWHSAWREGNSIYTEHITLNADGTCSYFEQRYDNYFYVPIEGEQGWYVPPMGWPSYWGTYTYEEGILTMHLEGDYYDERSEVFETYITEEGNLFALNLTNGEYHTYLDGNWDVWELCEQLGVDTSAD